MIFLLRGLFFVFCNNRKKDSWAAGDRDEKGMRIFIRSGQGIQKNKKVNYFFHLNMGINGLKRSGSSPNTDNFDDTENCLPFSLLQVMTILIS
jgi:hypothetical protein